MRRSLLLALARRGRFDYLGLAHREPRGAEALRAAGVVVEHQPAPLGVPGELCIGGAGVSPGYHAREALTSERFVTNAFDAGASPDATRHIVDLPASFGPTSPTLSPSASARSTSWSTRVA